MDVSMRVRMLYFGVLKDVLGREREEIELPDGGTVSDLLLSLRDNVAPALWKSLAIAVNREYAAASTMLHENDEVALLPPVSGGNHAG